MERVKASNTDLLIEPLKLNHLSMLKKENGSEFLGVLQVLLYKKWISSIESNLTNIIPTRNSTCFVAIENNNIIAYILASPVNKRGTCWSISEPSFIGDSISHSRYNILQRLLQKVIYDSNIKTQSFLIFINTFDSQNLSIIRQSGFQPLRIKKYWTNKNIFYNNKNETEDTCYWENLNKENTQQIWRLEQARQSINLRSIFDRQWYDIFEKRNFLTGVIKCKENQIIAGLIPSVCPQFNLSLELIRGLAWDERLNLLIPRKINTLKLNKRKFYLETTSEDNKLNQLLNNCGWVVQEEKILLGRSIWKRQNGCKIKPLENKIITNLVGNLQQQPELPSTYQD